MRSPRSTAAVAVLATVLATAVVTTGTARATAYVTDPASLVNPIIGTSGAVDDFPGADVPFGMVQWSPDTPSRPAGGGYEYNDKTVTGFSLTHVSGPGCAAAGDLPILPTTGAISSNPDAATLPLDHTKESAKAGDYTLSADGITTELTATTRSGMGRFTFPKGPQANLLLKLSDSAAGTDATHFQVVSNKEISGYVTSGHFCGATDSYTVYFDMVFDQPFTASGTYQNSTDVQAGARALTVSGTHRASTPKQPVSNGVPRPAPRVHGTTATASPRTASPNAQPPVTGASGAYLSFPTTSSSTVQTKVGISYVSTANATQNRTSENSGWDFASISAAAHAQWKALLGKIQVGGGSTQDQTVFYTAMYHALLHPNVFSDVNGQYAGFDQQVHTVAKGHVEYANYSGWDIYRSQVQLAAMVAPQQTSDSVRSMLNQYEQTGQLPKWALNNGESYVMVGDPADPIIADAYAFGARDFDTTEALQAMVHEAGVPGNVRPALSQYLSKGYIPIDQSYGCCNFYGPVSTQQEYNTADHAISTFASSLGQTSTATTFAARANNWQNVFNPATGYLQPKQTDGAYTPGFVPGSSNGFVEGNSYQYTPMEPFDIKGLVAADGGNAAWITKLDGLTSTIKDPGSSNADFGNEPSIEIPWEYDYVGAPWKTQQVVRQIQQQIFPAAPAGIAGNDDLGTMSAWYVFSALGFYPETPGTAELALGSPVFPKAAVHLASGKTLTITGTGAGTSSPYVQSMTVNGAAWSHAYLSPALVSTGGTVAVTLGSTPNKSWGSAAADAPPSDTAGLLPALPYSTSSNVIATPGSEVDVTIGARNLTGTAQPVSWTSTTSDGGPSTGISSGTLQTPAHKDATQTVGVSVPSTEGRYTVRFSFTAEDGTALPDVVVEVDAAKPGELWPYYNNAGTASDGQSGQADFDGDGYAYSAQALAAQGVTPGATVKANGLSYTWPDTTPGDFDNIEAGGQSITLPAVKAATRIGVLGSTSNGDPGSDGTAIVHFSDGTSQNVSLGLSDWTLNAGSGTPSYGNTTVAKVDYRDTTDGTRQTVGTYLFSATATLSGGKTVTGITLPATVSAGQLHVFAIAAG